MSADRLGSMPGGAKLDPYGQEIVATANDKIKFATYLRDGESGLDYAMNWYYSSGTGGFLTADPMISSNALVLPGNWNRYTYVGDGPINKTDPLGFCSPDDDPPCYSSNPIASGSDPTNPDCLPPGEGPTDMPSGLPPCPSNGRGSKSGGVPGGGGGGGDTRSTVLGISQLSKNGKNYDKVANTFQRILDSIDPDCLGFLQSGGNNLNQYVNDLLANSLLAVGSFSNNNYAAITGTAGTSLQPGDAAIVVNNNGAFFSSAYTVDNGAIQGGTAMADAFILLHELGHALSAQGFQADGPYAKDKNAGIQNDQLIQQNCQKTLNQFR